MAQVIKHQLGGNIQYKSFTPAIQEVLGINFNTQNLLDYLKDKTLRTKYTNDYRGFTAEQTNDFNTSLDSYIKGIEDGKIVFSKNGLTKLTNIDGVDPRMEPYVQDYFISSIKNNLIQQYDESYKNNYELDLQKTLSRQLLGEEVNPSVFNPAWYALDPLDEKSNTRGITNRKQIYVKAMQNEANRLENDIKYRSRFKFSGWETDLNAYRRVVQALRKHADDISKVNDIKKEEQWIQGAASLGLAANTIRNYFNDAGVDIDNPEQEQEQHPDGGFEGLGDFLSTKNPTGYFENKQYTISDDYENLPDKLKEAAMQLLALYDRKQIKADWFYWTKYKNKYLENLTPHFSGQAASVYSVSNGPLNNEGKKFFIRRDSDENPIEVELIKNADGTYSAHNKDINLNLGNYIVTEETRAARTYDDFGDLGKPIQFNLNEVIKDANSINDFFNYLIQVNKKYLNPKMFSNILIYLSAWLWQKPDGREYTNWKTGKGNTQYGSTFEIRGTSYNHPTAFIWKFRDYGIKFEFKKPTNYINILGRDSKSLDYRDLKSVTIDYAHKLKEGGKLQKLQYGGVPELVEYQKKKGQNRPVTFDPLQTPQKTEQDKKEDDKIDSLNFEGEPTTADRIRFVAATTDLLSSFLAFPKGTNIAALTGTGLSFLGYVTADMKDVIDGKLPLAETLLDEAKLAAVMAFPMFINPTKAKALGAGERMQKLAGYAAKYVGTAFALGQIASKEQRDDILRSWGKLSNPTKMDAHDLTNIAFTLRLVAGVKEHVKSAKSNKQLKKAQEEAKTGKVNYTIKNGDKEISDHITVTKGDDLHETALKERILKIQKELNPEAEESTLPKLEDITITNEEYKPGYKDYFKKDRPKKSDEKLYTVKWEENNINNPNPEYTDWIPSRAFQKYKYENGILTPENTKFGNWIRNMLGPNWDLVYSDYRLTHGYRLGKIYQLNRGLFKSLDELRKQGKELEEIRAKGLSPEDTTSELIQAMGRFGYNTIDGEATVAKANELADFYVSDLSKYDNLQIAQMMYDKDREMGIFGKSSKAKEEKSAPKEGESQAAEVTETPEATPTVEENQSKLNPNGLEYKTKEELTPDLLKEAYEKFVQEKQRVPEEGQPSSLFNELFNTQSRTNDERRNLVSKIFSSFNVENTKLLIQSQEAILRKLMRLTDVKNKINKGENLSPQELQKALKKLVEKGQLSEADYSILTSTDLSGHEIANATPSYDIWTKLGKKAEEQKQKKNNYLIQRPYDLDTKHWGLLDKILRNVLKEKSIRENIKNKKKPTLGQLDALINKYYNEALLTDQEKSTLLSKNGDNTHYTPEGNIIISEIQKYVDNIIQKHMIGGKLIFAHQVLSAANGTKIQKLQQGGGIRFIGSWYNDFFKPGIQEVTNDFMKLLDNPDGTYDYLFEPGENSLYSASNNYSNIRKQYEDNYAESGGYYMPEDNSVRNYQLWVYNHFPSLLRTNTNLAQKSGQYVKNGRILTEEFLPEGVEYEGDNKAAERTMNLHLGNTQDITDPNEYAQWLKWASYLQDVYKDKYTFYLDNTNGNLSVYNNDTPPSEDLKLTSLSDYISDNDIDLSSVSNPYTPDAISSSEQIAAQTSSNKPKEGEETLQELPTVEADWYSFLPKDNLTTARILNTLFGNAATFAIRDKYKPIFAKDQTYLKTARVFRDPTALNETDRTYGQFLARQQGLSSDQRVNIAAQQDLMSKYETARQAANAQNKKVFDTTSEKAEDTAATNSLNLTNTYNANLKKFSDQMALQQEYSASALKQAGENISNLFSALIQEKGTDRLYARKHYLDSQMAVLQQSYSEWKNQAQEFYYRRFKTANPNSTRTRLDFYNDPAFINSEDYNKYINDLNKAAQTYQQNINNLYTAMFSSNLFNSSDGYNRNPGDYSGQSRDDNTQTQTITKKSGGKISMAKQGGASVNWVRVENARMLNKQVNTSMQETYKSLRAANMELQKTIRAMEPLIRKLNRRDSVKLK